MVVIQGVGIIKAHFCLVGGYGEGRGRLLLEGHSEGQWTPVGKKEIPARCKENYIPMNVLGHWRGRRIYVFRVM